MNQHELTTASSIGLLYLVRMLGLFMVLPVLPLVAPAIDGATPLLVGLAIGIYGLSQAALQIPFGLMSDRIGRKQIIALGLGLFITGSLVAGFADDIYMLILGRFMQGCGAIASTLLALMSDLTRVDQRSKAMAFIGIAIAGSFGLSLVLGPLVANALGLAGLFFLTAALGGLALAILLLCIPTPQIRGSNLDASVQRGMLGMVVRDLGLWRVNISVFTLHYLLVSLFTVLPVIFMNTRGIDTGDHSLYYLLLLLVSFIVMLPFMWLSDRMQDVRIILMVMVSPVLAAFCIMGSLASYWWVLAGVILFFMSFNLLEVFLPAQLSKMADAGTRGTAMGVYTTCQFLGIFAGGAVSGWILHMADISTLMCVDAGIVAIWLLICLTFPSLRAIGARTISLREMSHLDANEQAEELSSVTGVIDAVIIKEEQVAYLKVDETTFREESISEWVRSTGPEA